MKLNIFAETPPPEKSVTLKLEQHGDGINVVAVDPDGEKLPQGTILKFMPGGRIYRLSTVATTFGFDLDEIGRVKFN